MSQAKPPNVHFTNKSANLKPVLYRRPVVNWPVTFIEQSTALIYVKPYSEVKNPEIFVADNRRQSATVVDNRRLADL
uniref:Uncharacterized protein n=1 Tax=Romanomermis culicivorax TaxID=13658 RepID=A0A915L556_ROMCU